MEYIEKYNEWLKNEKIDEDTKVELRNIKEDEEEVKIRFYKELEFGTGGLRGVMGAGTNRMNIYTVGKATQGLANYILNQGKEKKGVAIAYDSRNMSYEFGLTTALCLNANGIKTYMFDSLRPVPELSFAIRTLGCTAGVMITASHNPPKYNGYKVYWEDGAQIIAPQDKEIIQEANCITDYGEIKTIKIEEAKEKKLFHIIGKEIDDQYIEELKKLSINKDIIKEIGKELKIVYTPLHGTGNIPVRRILKELGFENVYIVKEQELPNGNFPTVSYPNPEEKEAFHMALDLAKEIDADIVLATDPDADRVGAFVKDEKTKEYILFNGNQIGITLVNYLLEQKKQKDRLPKNGAIIETIVTSNMAKPIAKKYNVELIEVLTGFKYIGDKIKQFEETKEFEYIFGFEESFGCLTGTYARDKDAVGAVAMLCEAAAYYKSKKLTLWDKMLELYEEYGYYKADIYSLTLEGISGAEKIKNITEDLRKNPPHKIGEYSVLKVRDYQISKITDLETRETTNINLPKSNVLYYELENNAWFCVRPSRNRTKDKSIYGDKGRYIKRHVSKIGRFKKCNKRVDK